MEFLEWVSENESIAKQYARAMEWRAEGLLEDTIVIADARNFGTWLKSFDADGNPVLKADIEHIHVEDTIEATWRPQKMAPKRYGDKD